MALLQNLATLAVSPLLGKACEALGLVPGEGAVGGVAQFLARRFTEHSQRLTEALRRANDSDRRSLQAFQEPSRTHSAHRISHASSSRTNSLRERVWNS